MSGQYERELINALDAIGIPAMRAPSSGSATNRDLPDVLAARSISAEDITKKIQETTEISPDEGAAIAGRELAPLSETYGIEHKAQQGTTLYVKSSEVKKLLHFCDLFGARPRLCARFREQRHPVKHFMVHPDDARQTDDGSYGLPVKDIESRASEIVTPDTNTRDAKIEIL